MAPNPTDLQQIPLCCLLKPTFLPFPACPWGNAAQVRDHHAAGAVRSQPEAVDGGHGREGAGECPWSRSQLECAAQQCPLPAAVLGITAAPSPRAPCPSLSSRSGFWASPRNLGVFPALPFPGWFTPAPHCLLEMIGLPLLLAALSSQRCHCPPCTRILPPFCAYWCPLPSI